jgi:hypothetical protein
MQDILKWALAYRWRVVLLTVALAVSQLTAPFASALLVLCGLAKSPRQALLSAVAATGVLALLAVIAGGQIWEAPATLVGWTMVIGMAWLVQRFGSLNIALQLASLLAVVVIVVWGLFLPDPGSTFEPQVHEWLSPLISQGTLQADPELIRRMAELMPGIMVSAILATQIISLALGRYWHGLLLGNDQFGTEFRQYRVGRIVGLISTAGLLAGLFWQGPNAGSLIMVTGSVFLVQGLSVAHAVVKESGLGRAPLIIMYLALVFAAQLAIPLVLAVGLVDNWLDLRGRLFSRK